MALDVWSVRWGTVMGLLQGQVDAMFRRTAGGRIAFYPWGGRSGRIVTPEVERSLRRRLRVILLAAFILMCLGWFLVDAADWLVAALEPGLPMRPLVAFVFVLLAQLGVFLLAWMRWIRPLYQGTKRTREPLNRAESTRKVVAAAGAWWILFLPVADLLVLTMAGVTAQQSHNLWVKVGAVALALFVVGGSARFAYYWLQVHLPRRWRA